MQSKIIAGNFKANLTRKEVLEYAKELEALLDSKTLHTFLESHSESSLDSEVSHQVSLPKVVIFPSLSALLEDNFSHFHIGTQNAYFAKSGGYTGEVGLEQLKEFGISRILIGHSERRGLLGENQAFVAQKFRFFAEAGFEIYYCIGEDLSIREKGKEALKAFLASQFEGIDLSYKRLIVAYEPIWAIGTGVSASLEQIATTHEMLSSLTNTPLLYGGSVNATNAKEILSLPHVNGVLVGSASLSLQSFRDIIHAGLKI